MPMKSSRKRTHFLVLPGGGYETYAGNVAVRMGPVRLQFWVCGTFEVHGGQIALWRDYFDAFDFFVKAPLRAIAGLVLPSLKPKFQ